MNKIGVHFGYFNRDWNTDFVKQIETIKRIGFRYTGSGTCTVDGTDKTTER